MPAQILDGKVPAQKVRKDVAAEVVRLKAEHGVVPGLTVVLVGENPASQVYVRNKQNACEAAGVCRDHRTSPAETSESTLLATIDRLNVDPKVHGILVQLPLPAQINERAVIERIKSVERCRRISSDQRRPAHHRHASVCPLHPARDSEMLIHHGVKTRGAHAAPIPGPVADRRQADGALAGQKRRAAAMRRSPSVTPQPATPQPRPGGPISSIAAHRPA